MLDFGGPCGHIQHLDMKVKMEILNMKYLIHGKNDIVHQLIFNIDQSPNRCALVRELKVVPMTLIKMAGHPCRSLLLKYQDADLINLYIKHIDLTTNATELSSVPISLIISKIVILSVSNNHYCVIQPNHIERH